MTSASPRSANCILDSTDIILGKRFASGGSANVYQGKFHGLPVAIKTFKSSAVLEDLFKEVKHWCTFDHPHLLSYLGYAFLRKGPSIVMELMDTTLYQILHKPKSDDLQVNFHQGIYMAKCLASGLNYLHEREIIHRDIKSPNILIRNFYPSSLKFEIKLADFGATRSLDTMKNTTSQVLSYMWAAPELHKGARASLESDIYAFAMVLFEILMQELPFSHLNTPFEVTCAIHNQERPIISVDRIVLAVIQWLFFSYFA